MKNRDMRPMSAMALPHKAHACTSSSTLATKSATYDQFFRSQRGKVTDETLRISSSSEPTCVRVSDSTKQTRRKNLSRKSSDSSPSGRSSSSSSRFSFDECDDGDTTTSNEHVRLRKRPSIAESVPINVETVTTVLSPSVKNTTSLEEIKEINLEEALVETKTVLIDSRSSSKDDDSDSRSTSPSLDDLPASIETALQRKRMSFAESITLSVESAAKIPNPLLSRVDAEVVTEGIEEEEIGIKEQDALKMKSTNVSGKTSSTADVVKDGLVKRQELDESLQSDEERVVRSASVRGDIHQLIKEENLKTIVEITQLRPELREKVNESGWRPIHVVSADGKLEILQWLIETGSDLNAETTTGYAAIHMAALHGHVTCVMALHAAGSDIDGINLDGQTPLHLASMSGHLETVKWLIANHADLGARDVSFRTALDLSKQYHHAKVTTFLTSCLHEVNDEDNTATLQETRSLSQRSASISSSEYEKLSQDERHQNSEKEDNGTIADVESSSTLDEKRKMYDKQRRKMVRRRSSFLDVIRDEAQRSSFESDSSSTSDNDSPPFH